MTTDVPAGLPGPGAPTVSYVGLGANLGDAEATLASAVDALGRMPVTKLVRMSALYRSASIGAEGPDFLNAVAELLTRLPAGELLRELLRIESEHGRERRYRNAPRTLDLDLLLHGAECLTTADLVLPHPRLHERAFVLRPLAELAPGLIVPGRGPVAALLEGVAGQRADKI